MKLAVVGLLKRQERMIAREFSYLDIRFASKESRDGSADIAMLNNVDRILVMANFINHSLYHRMDRSKLTLIHGGLTKLRHVVTTIGAAHKIADKAAPVVAMHTQEEEEDMATKLDFTPLKTAKVGQTMRFTRPPRTTIAAFELQVMQGRSYYKRKHGVFTKYSSGDGYIDVTVIESPEAVAKAVPPAPEPAAAPERPVLRVEGTVDRRFWQEVYLQAMRNNPAGGAFWKATADEALDALVRKCGG